MLRFGWKTVVLVTVAMLSVSQAAAAEAGPGRGVLGTAEEVERLELAVLDGADSEGDRWVSDALEREGLVLHELEVDEGGVEVELEVPGDSLQGDTEIAIDLQAGSAVHAVTATTRSEGTVTEQALELEIRESTFSEFDFRLTDPVSGTSLRFDSESPIESIAFAIPLVFVGVSVAAALKWLAVGAAVVVGGVLMVEAAKAVDRILNNRNRRHEHYAAVLRNGRLYVGGGLSRAAALARGRSGGDVWSTSRTQAHAVARDVNTACRPIGPEIHRGNGMLYHFHPCRRTPKMHAFFGSPV